MTEPEIEQLQREHAAMRLTIRHLMRWILLAYDAEVREGWESGLSIKEARIAMHSLLCLYGLDPAKKGAERLRQTKPEYYSDDMDLAMSVARKSR